MFALNECDKGVCAGWTWQICLHCMSVIDLLTMDECDKCVHTGWAW